MANKIVIEGSGPSALQMKEFWGQVGLGIINGEIMQAIIEHQNPWAIHTLIVDRSVPFDPSKFISPGWTIWKGPKIDDGLIGEEEQGRRSLALTEVDFSKVFFETCLYPGETEISGEEKIIRHVALNHLCADAKIGPELLREKGQKILMYLLKEKGIEYFELPGTILRSRRGHRYTLYLYWAPRERQWGWSYEWLDRKRGADRPSLVLEKG